MKCKYGNDNMVLSKDEYIWHCPHCGYEKFATRSAYNELKREAQNFTGNLQEFLDRYTGDDCVQILATRAWSKTNQVLNIKRR
jgi:hypothetical protein